MHLGLKTLESFLETHRAEPYLVLVTVVATEGSTYRKPGAMMLVNGQQDFAGLVSGGCLEGDLVARTRDVLRTGEPRHVSYDLQDEEDPSLGLGLGCGGAVHLLLRRLSREDGFEPLASLFASLARGAACRLALVRDSRIPGLRAGDAALAGDDGATLGPPALLGLLAEEARSSGVADRARDVRLDTQEGSAEVLLVEVQPTPRVLVCGAGPDALPLVRQVTDLGWNCTVFDHRPAFADPERFPEAARVVCARADAMTELMDLAAVDAAVVMYHHLEHDAACLARLAGQPPPYIGLLGPRARRDRLLAEIGAPDLAVHGPAGLDIGAELPEAIALAIMGEIHARLAGRAGGALTRG